MNKYVYSVCTSDDFPYLDTISGQSYNDAVNKLIQKYIDKYDDDDKIVDIEDFDDLQVHLNEYHDLVISDLYDIEDL